MAENLRFNLDVDTTAAVGSINDFFNTFADGAAQAKSKLNTAFGQGVQTQIKVEFKNGELVAKQVQAVNQESKRLGDIFDAVNGKIGKTPNELRKSISVLQGLRDNTAKFGASTGKVTSDWKVLTEKINKAKQALNDMTRGNAIQQLGSAIQGLAGRFALVQTLANALQGALQGIAQGTTDFVVTGERLNLLEKELAAFTGSTENANKAFEQFQKTAASTKFNVEQVANAGKILLAYGVDVEAATEATDRLAIVASATGGDVELLARNLGQTASQGRAYTRDLTQFAIQGIPIWEELAIVTGKSTAELKELATEGKIGFSEVNQALENMTAEGSAFAQIAKEVQNTYTGSLRVVESAVQKLAKEFVQTAEAVDKAFGGPVINSIKTVAGLLNFLADNWRTITSLIVAASTATAVYLAISNFGVIVAGFRAVVTALQGLQFATSAAAVAQAVLQGLLGNWVAIGSALAAGTAVAIGLNAALENQALDAAAAADETGNLTNKVGELTEAELKLAEAAGQRDLKKQYTDALEVVGKYQEALDEEKTKLKELQKATNEKFKEEKELLSEKSAQIKEALQQEKDGLADLKTQLKDRYDSEKESLQEKLQIVKDIYDEEIGRLEALTPAEERLRELRKKELQDKAQSNDLSEKERLEAQATLERMEAQDKIRDLRIKKDQETSAIQDQLKKKEEEYKAQVEEVTKASERRQGQYEAELEANKVALKDLDQAQKDYNKSVTEALNSNVGLNQTLDEMVKKTNEQENAVYRAANALDVEKAAADRLAESLRNAAAAQRELNAARVQRLTSGSTVQPASQFRASGGPVAGGGSYTVNELGREAFLSASGKLSMINAPSWGSWRAPGAGTVIPAHLTSKLDIPSGGVNINSAARASAARAGAEPGSSGKLLRALSGIQGAGNVNNNVTIQAANTTKAASDMLVELTKIKRRRYS